VLIKVVTHGGKRDDIYIDWRGDIREVGGVEVAEVGGVTLY
jgi:hypothetical protein